MSVSVNYIQLHSKQTPVRHSKMRYSMGQSGKIETSILKQLTFGLLLILLLALVESQCIVRGRNNWPRRARNQRQIVNNELASGFSGTGTSFNSFYGDPYYTQQQQNTYQMDDNDYPGSGSQWPKGGYGGGSGGSIPTLSTNINQNPYGGSYGGSAYGSGAQGWRGFGASKGGRGSGYKGAIAQKSSYGSGKY